MSGALLSLFLDVAILVCLGATIYYAFVLSRNLNAFRQNKDAFDQHIAELSKQIERAENAVEHMKKTSELSGNDLQDLIDQSRLLADELQLMNEAGNSLAKRLEGLAEQNSRTAHYEDAEYEAPAKKQTQAQNTDAPSFFIQDRDFDEREDAEGFEDGGFQSQAEKELYNALKKKKKSGGGAL